MITYNRFIMLTALACFGTSAGLAQERFHAVNLPADLNFRDSAINSSADYRLWQEDDEPKPKNTGTALAIALGNTIIPTGVAFAITSGASLDNDAAFGFGALLLLHGVLVGPSTGNLYAKDKARGWGGVGIRLLSVLIIDLEDDDSLRDGLGVGLLLGSALYNIGTAPTSVREYNQRLKAEYGMQMFRVPGNDRTAPLMTVRLHF